MQILPRGISTRDERLGMTMKQNHSTVDAINQEQIALDLETLRGIEEPEAKISEITMPNYIAITIVHNEEAFIEETIKSVLSQSPQPNLYIVVDDDSTDETPSIIAKYPVLYMKIYEPRLFLGSMNMQRALTKGIERATELVPDWEFLLKVDADSIIPPNYFHQLHSLMGKYPRIGICSGIMKGGKIWKGRASDGAKIYRRECFNEIGGLDRIIHWDTHAILKAYHKGWNVSAFSTIEYEETRTSERQNLYEWYITGLTRFLLGFPLYHTICVGAVYLRKKPYVIGSLMMIMTQLIQILRRQKRPFSKSYYEYVKKYAVWETLIRLRRVYGVMLRR